MLKRLAPNFAALMLILVLAACAGPGQNMQPDPIEIRTGVIEQITPTQITSNQHSGVGAVLGGLVGIGVGSLIGNGSGRDVAMVAGAIGGGLLGNEIQKKHDQPIAAQQIVVRTGTGVLVVVTQPVDPTLNVGQRVIIQGNGESAFVTRQ
jgi:outer membrane lipoprotein SlyB